MDPSDGTAAAPDATSDPAPAPAAEPTTESGLPPGVAPGDTVPAEAPVADPVVTEAPAAKAAEPKVNLTARLAELSIARRTAESRARTAEKERDAATAKTKDLGDLLERAKTDPSAIPDLFSRAGLDFKKVVDFYAAQGEEPAPEQVRDKEIADLKEWKKQQEAQREEDKRIAADRAADAARAEHVSGISNVIKANAEKYEICARLGDEAASDVFAEVTDAWEKAGRPQLMPGEYDEAVMAAIELKELHYEERGKKLQKQAKQQAAAADAAKAAAADPTVPAKGTRNLPKELPSDIAGGKLSDTDEDILRGLIDKSAPGANSQRAKPRTINSSLGGSAPPRTPARADMDPAEARRAVLAQLG